ncbi:hypothetical protein CDES_07350 [Corynebacterium deserti GIMN1.010]|uniref:N-acetyltransferase domain-containing protein n=1 Tax=Corynebacterium deserti GIMN1.010 TaxID=931089 RepID=A0A0M5IP97_9CORY|nr:GNAT family N-acetyltransferase [Corynebacterium deserti]ALC05881.1 hypothetical protein CDES_07350 [Corynebacterium deserti GIMN1.010]
MSLTIVPATPAHFPAIIDVLVEAFVHDPGFARLIPQPDPQAKKLRALFDLQIHKQYAAFGNIDIAMDEEGSLVGVSLWDRPDGNHSLKDQVKLLPHLVHIFGVKTAHLVAAELHSARFHPKFPHWYLYVIATKESARGTGVGTELLGSGIARAGDEAIYLEATSTRAAQLYHRLGFVSLGYIPSNAEGPQELAMWRPPTLPTT